MGSWAGWVAVPIIAYCFYRFRNAESAANIFYWYGAVLGTCQALVLFLAVCIGIALLT